MTKQEYARYEAAVADFFSCGLNNLSTKATADGEATEPFFSWRPCECCRTSLGGDRYECNGCNSTTGQIEEYDCICSDCVYYAEYGRLDDQTMWDIAHSEDE